ncbi:hypothetical protein, partial [Streptomyces sp. NPDC046985]|uniref:hypothetical protein n=1 Tax=Streptomyces sp. NPDC046985 TaxID=3155377 RepID=UPI0033E609B1
MSQRVITTQRYVIGLRYLKAMRQLLAELRRDEPGAVWEETYGVGRKFFYVTAGDIGHLFLAKNLEWLQ